MKVLMFGWEFPPHITGGLGTACFGMTKGLAKNGVDVLFVVPKAHGDEDETNVRLLNASDVTVNIDNEKDRSYWDRVQYMEIGSNIIPYVGPERFERLVEEQRATSHFQSPVFMPRYEFSGKYGANLMEEVSRYALIGSSLALEHKDEFDVIHAHDWLTYSAGIAAKETTGKPLVVHMHATEFDRSGENINTLVYSIERRGMEAADIVITVSDLTRKIVVEKYGINPDKVITVHNAVEPNDKKRSEYETCGLKNKVVTFLGRITMQKGPEYFVEVAAQVLRKTNNVRFVMAGSGDMMNKMIRLAAERDIADKFQFTGFLRGKQVYEMLKSSDVYMMPSVSEPFGISPLEAMQVGVPSIISKQSGCAEILNNVVKTDYWDVDAMADAVYSIITYPAMYTHMKEEGIREVNEIKWEYAGQKVIDIYRKVMKW